MRIINIEKPNQPIATKINKESYTYKRSVSLSKSNDVFFRGVNYIALRAAFKVGSSGINIKKFIKTKDQAAKLIYNPTCKTDLCKGISILASLETKEENKPLYDFCTSLFSKTEKSVWSMKKDVLENKILQMNSSNPEENFSVKDFMTAIFDDGENDYIYTKIFQALPDDKYGYFKEDIIDKILYSPEQDFLKMSTDMVKNNIDLLKSLDADYHKEFLKERKDKIAEMPKRLVQCVLRNLKNKDNKNEAYLAYAGAQEHTHCFIKSDFWKDFAVLAIISTISKNYPDVDKISEKLNIDKKYAQDIVKDIETQDLAREADTRLEQLELYWKRAKEKMSFKIDKYNKYNTTWFTEYDISAKNLEVQKCNVLTFIEGSPFKDELLTLLEKDLKTLDEKKSNANALNYQLQKENEQNYNPEDTTPWNVL